jgi:ESS family glutamate:Na+ symporter
MQFDVDVATTLLLAILVLLVGRLIVGRVALLNRYSIPDPVVGGVIAALVITLLRVGGDIRIAFDTSLQGTLLLAFFATIGLSADVRMLARGGVRLLVLLAVVVVFLILQNALGVAVASALDMHPLYGLLAGSVTMSGGHGTGAAYGKLFGEVNNLQGSMELAMAAATFGLVMGGIVGGPAAKRLIRRHRLQPAAAAATGAPGELGPMETRPLEPASFFLTLALVLLCVAIGSWLAGVVRIPWFTLPTFVWCLLTGIVLCNLLGLSGRWRVETPPLDFIGTVSLSLFLAMALMTLKLWELVGLALPMLAILALQTVLTVAYATFVTFPAMGRSYDAAVIAAGQCGFGLGATPTAIANMQAVTGRHGPSPLAFLLVPIIGAFLIDIANALVIQGYLALPWLGF